MTAMNDGHELAMRLRRAYLALHRAANALFAPHGVTADQFVILSLLAERDRVTQADLVSRSSSDPNTVRAMLVRLERAGLVRRDPHASDGRAKCVLLTAEGRRVHRRLIAAAAEFHAELAAIVSEAEGPLLSAALDRLAAVPALKVTGEECRAAFRRSRK